MANLSKRHVRIRHRMSRSVQPVRTSAAFSSNTATVGTYAPDGTQYAAANNTTHVRLVATSACWIAFGSNPVAVASGASSIYLPAFTPEYFWVNKGEKVAVIQDAASGNLNIGELVA
jgi:hypothetical protein